MRLKIGQHSSLTQSQLEVLEKYGIIENGEVVEITDISTLERIIIETNGPLTFVNHKGGIINIYHPYDW